MTPNDKKSLLQPFFQLNCGASTFLPKAQKARCMKPPPQRSEMQRSDQAGLSEIMPLFDDFVEEGRSSTKCSNSIFEQYNVDPMDIIVDCSLNKCRVTCSRTGESPDHVWPDGKRSKTGTFICRGKTSWVPSKGTIECP